MGLTAVSKPSGFRPVGSGDLLYLFTESSISGKTNYRVEIELDGFPDIPIFEFRPDASLAIECNIAPMLRAALSLVEATSSRFQETYVKYQAVWDESSDAQVPLSSDVISFYTGVNHKLNRRTQFQISKSNGGPFLLWTDKLYAWAGRTQYLDFLNDDDMDADGQVVYTPEGGSPVQIHTFDGSVKGLQSVSYQYPSSGTITVGAISSGDTYATIEVEILPECAQPVYIKWINDFGGLTAWLFSYNQVYELSPQILWRDNSILVTADILTWEQWQALQELHKEGIEYGDNQKAGVYCIDMTDEDNELVVFPIAESKQTMTKMVRHQFDITLRYEQIPNIEL